MADVKVKGYRRSYKQRPITFVCQDCGEEVTEMRFPGPTPKWCRTCKPNVLRRQAYQRKWRQRQRERGRSENE